MGGEEKVINNNDKIILDLCGGTGAWSKPYKDAGYDVRIITLPEYDVLRTHVSTIGRVMFQGKTSRVVIEVEKIYGILAAPPCTMFSLARTTAKTPRDLEEGMRIVETALKVIWACRYQTKLKFWALENPLGYLRQFLGKPPLTFNPTDYGDCYNKKTDLWGYFNIPKKNIVKPKFILDKNGRRDSIIHAKTGGTSEKTKRLRSITPAGFAKAFYEANK